MAHISGISDRRTLAHLLSADEVSTALRLNSTEAEPIEALERILFYLGFGEELQWAMLGADGHYEAHTVAAVAAFATREGLAGDGAETTPEQLRRILESYDSSLERDRARLRAIQQSREAELVLKRQSPDTEKVKVLQRMLYVVGYGDEMKWEKFGDDGDYGSNTTRAVTAFALDANMTSDGAAVSAALLSKLIEAVANQYERPVPLLPDKLNVTEASIFVENNSGRQKIASKVKYGHRMGWRAAGNMPFARFLEGHPEVFAHQPASILRVLHAVVQNEGSLDAVNAYDNAFLSFGILQWTAGVAGEKGELAGFLNYLKTKHPAVFQKYFGVFGLEPTGVTGGTHFPACGHMTLHGRRLDSPEKKAALRREEWVYRFWRSGHDPLVQQAEVEYALMRLGIFYRNPTKKVRGCLIADYVSSEMGVALLFDQHINRPGHVPVTLAEAIEDLADELGDPNGWDDEAERRLLDCYLELRHETNMTDSAKRAQQILDLAGAIISPRRGSFQL